MMQTPIDPSLPVRLGVVGLGRMGRRHAENIARLATVELAGVTDALSEHVAQTAQELRCPGYDGLEPMLSDARLDGIVVATPAAAHLPAIEQAARHGVHVLCEKPLAPDLQTGMRAVAIAEEAGIMLGVGFQMRFDRDLRRLADLVRSGELGRLYQFRASLRDVAPPSRAYLESSGGYFRDGAIHCFDLARWLFGEVYEVAAYGAALSDPMFEEIGDVDNAIVVLRFAGGQIGAVDVSRVAAYGFDSSVEVLAEHGAVRVADGSADGLRHYEHGRMVQRHVLDFMERFAPAYPDEVEGFAAQLRGGSASCASGSDGVEAMRIADAATRSASLGAPVQLEHDA
jgi:myo-inositol 2-dehydrogenase/D-chiro-inositol 1-dehydrogenase